MGVIILMSVHARHSAQPCINTSINFLAHMSGGPTFWVGLDLYGSYLFIVIMQYYNSFVIVFIVYAINFEFQV